MSLTIACNGCGQKLKANEQLFGKTVKCPKCSAALKIPAPKQEPAADDLGDLLDDEFTPAPLEEEAAAAKGPVAKCERCGDELTPGSRYCVACGHNNLDMDAAVGGINMELDKRYERMEAQGRPRHWLWRAIFFWS